MELSIQQWSQGSTDFRLSRREPLKNGHSRTWHKPCNLALMSEGNEPRAGQARKRDGPDRTNFN